ncbi:hypothetical protein DPX16_4216 [Anabarilius grahami]|uniref:C2H2-type domain-containing protein n=1 Tax=Anabarilius grahami TaxID=495550 RepID=A0A3N0YQX6_ANAGA|nr:hypothetical protein DPX16_4216 [Anabarilius grahami]
MLVQVECKRNPKWIRIPVKNDSFDFCEFIKEASAKFNLPYGANVVLKDSAGVDVDADIFDELVRTSKVSFKILDGDTADNVPQAKTDFSEPSCPESSFSSVKSESSDSTVIPQSSKARKKRFLEEPSDCNASKDLVHAALHSKPGGSDILKEYEQTKSLSDKTRRKLVNILVANMVEKYGRIPQVSICVSYALGIITLFPNLKDKCSPTGYEQYYDLRSGQGYIAYRLKTVQRNSVNNLKGVSKVVYQDGPKTLRRSLRLKCGEPGCSSVFYTYYGFKKHILGVHRDCVASGTAENIGSGINVPVSDTLTEDPPVTFQTPVENRQLTDMCSAIVAQVQAAGVSENTVQCLVSSMEELD